jgi:MFS family permease
MAMLLLVYTFNFIDRQIIGVLAIPIKAELGLSDTQLGLMGGLAFALFYTALGVPIALLADRTSRKWIITGALALWSLFTALCGATTGFLQLFLCRLGVGVGEAGGVAPAYSLIADVYPPERRGRAMALFSLGIPLGSALGVFFGGYVAAHFSWRVAFVAVGLAGIVIAPVFALLVREPERGRFDHGKATVQAPVADTLRPSCRCRPSGWCRSARRSVRCSATASPSGCRRSSGAA